ncbi:NAD(P)H-hydrate epimerase [Cellulomonas fimi]|uniref:Bifunctional NAD(P)H-hydrate repair enzyme n=1 Tax=Cellulomonas fimi (strain ATCC 484 / DSM 20113 / JCM 1341 / CCUG 24087 / LMG 16345 / NBRC 15513 / NCIMB 8980 / NCTC 7547 / NRS-133) TaxID=590998 RepID=F4H218_CELFA|nr:NAD(P)H-hydrate epimerase [Cellulomonas fimi]AEE45188.1 carbohydrate kinase, YjeF related protein [Cellulomonas fimi ATCC 484]VEH28508.1 Nicotinamide nucleotide repair protein [Cellulomonas fimi]
MRPVLLTWNAARVRAAEEPLLAAGAPLMAHAAFALHVAVARELRARRGRVAGAVVVVLAGAGNNGGDALHAGALLARRGARVLALTTAQRWHDEGAAALLAAGGRLRALVPDAVDDDAAQVLAADVVLDGVLGIGARGGLRGPVARLVEAVAAARPDGDSPLVVAVDVPSGIGVDDGTRAGTVLDADLTVTFGGAKPGLVLPPAAWAAGRVEVVDLGLALAGPADVASLGPDDVAALWPVPERAAHKYARGVVGVVAGTRTYPGAAVLASSGAALAGVGMVRYVGDAGDAVLAARPEVVVGPGRVQAWVLGPGVSPDDAAQRRRVQRAFDGVLHRGEAAVVDAGALDLLPERVGPHVVLTPHAGELARLLAQHGVDVERTAVEAEPLRWAREAHDRTGATVLLKGGTTVVVGAHGAVYAQSDGPTWLATAGAGDVLAGVLGALLAARVDDVHEDPSLAAALAAAAALVHGRAAHRAVPDGPIVALAVAHAVPATVAELLRATGTLAR